MFELFEYYAQLFLFKMIKFFTLITITISLSSYLLLNVERFQNIDLTVVRNILNQASLTWFPLLQFFNVNEEKLFTQEELSKYTDQILYLSILGKVFDVTNGRKFYGPGEGYHNFVGRDASKAFITGDFSKVGLTDDLTGLSLSDLAGLRDWVTFYEKDYIYKGKLIGTFYDKEGSKTPLLEQTLANIERADLEKESSKRMEYKYPPCNVEWDEKNGSRVWCSNQSGGVKRKWVGVPRQFYQPGKAGYRCACVQLSKDSNTIKDSQQGNFKSYKNCKLDSISCYVKE